MGPFECERHGRGRPRCACRHVIQAQLDGRAIPVTEVVVFTLTWICGACEAALVRAVADQAAVREVACEITRPWCTGCIEEWRARCGIEPGFNDIDIDRFLLP